MLGISKNQAEMPAQVLAVGMWTGSLPQRLTYVSRLILSEALTTLCVSTEQEQTNEHLGDFQGNKNLAGKSSF
jgi:hypothetical protein